MRLIATLYMLLGLWLVLTTSAQENYTTDDGFFSLTIPEGWTSETIDNGLILTSDETAVTVYLVTRDAETSADAVIPAFDALGLSYGEPVSEQDAPLPNGVWRQAIYANGTDLTLGLAQAQDGRALVMVVTGTQAELQGVNPQILNILTSIQVGEISLPPYVAPETFSERDVEFGNEPFLMQGTLSVPVGESTFPAVVIVHGSGPSDRNGTLGVLAAYRDIAQGLASQGIIVLRYDKRTLTYGAQMQIDDTFTVDSEQTDDAVLAVEFLKTVPEVNGDQIFVLGHSQGAGLTPRIVDRSEGVAGGIIMAGATRSFSTLVAEQIAYISEVNPDSMTNPAVLGLQQVLTNYAAVAEGASYADVFGAQAEYFESLEQIDPIRTAQDIDEPLLVLQGERDYQVTMTDFAGWQEAFGDSDRVTLISYPSLNHQFMAQGDLSRPGIPQDYENPAFVSAEVIQDIANWVDENMN